MPPRSRRAFLARHFPQHFQAPRRSFLGPLFSRPESFRIKGLARKSRYFSIILTRRPSGDRREVDGIGHGGVARPVGMELVARPADGGIGLVLRLHLAGRGVEGRGVE